jgi:uncharacterized protein (UPF0332 family)
MRFRNMPTLPSEILTLAGRIRDDHPGECGMRSAASRAYYAALHQAEQVFGKVPPSGERLSSHEQVIRAAAARGRQGDVTAGVAARIAANLTSMRIARNRADYKLQERFSEAQCRDMFIRANAVMNACNEVAP